MIDQFFFNNNSTQWNVTACESFGKTHEIGYHTVVIDTKPFSCPAESAHHFVGDKEDAVGVSQASYASPVSWGVFDAAAGATLTFHQYGCNVSRAFVFNDAFHV